MEIIAIDLKSFYASVECRERGLDPLTTNLVVADARRTEKTIFPVSKRLSPDRLFCLIFHIVLFNSIIIKK